MSFEIVVGDTAPALQVATTPIPPEGLVGASAVLRHLHPDGTTSDDLTLVQDDPTAGTWIHEWLAGETDAAGVHLGQVVVTLGSGAVMTFPSDGTFVRWRVNAQLA